MTKPILRLVQTIVSNPNPKQQPKHTHTNIQTTQASTTFKSHNNPNCSCWDLHPSDQPKLSSSLLPLLKLKQKIKCAINERREAQEQAKPGKQTHEQTAHTYDSWMSANSRLRKAWASAWLLPILQTRRPNTQTSSLSLNRTTSRKLMRHT